MLPSHSPPWKLRWRLTAALLIGLAFAAACFAYHSALRSNREHYPSDWFQLHSGARELIAGRNPYAALGPGRPYEFPTTVGYPATAMVAVMPLAAMPLTHAEAAFFGLR